MKNIILGFGAVLILVLVADASDNRFQIGEVEKLGNDHFSLGIHVDNVDTIAGFQIPMSFAFNGLTITLDSVIFAGHRCENFEFLDSKIDNDGHVVYISGVNNISAEADNEPLLPGQGEIARIYFTYESDPGNAQLQIKQAHYEMGGNRLEYRFWKPDATEVRFRFEAPPIQLPQ